MAIYRRSARPRFTLLVLVLTSITLVTLDYRGTGSSAVETVKGASRDALAPVQEFSDRLFAPVGSMVGGILHYGDLQAENERLRQEIADHRGQLHQAQAVERERQALLAINALGSVQDVPRVHARVVSTSASNFELALEIDKGADAGVVEGMPVVSGAGLVGRVSAVSQRRSTVVLLTDKTFGVGVVLPSGDTGVANGGGFRADLTVDHVEPDTAVALGDSVVTSGLQRSLYPRGIPVGRVTAASAPAGALQQSVSIAPVVDLERLSFVTVLQWTAG